MFQAFKGIRGSEGDPRKHEKNIVQEGNKGIRMQTSTTVVPKQTKLELSSDTQMRDVHRDEVSKSELLVLTCKSVNLLHVPIKVCSGATIVLYDWYTSLFWSRSLQGSTHCAAKLFTPLCKCNVERRKELCSIMRKQLITKYIFYIYLANKVTHHFNFNFKFNAGTRRKSFGHLLTRKNYLHAHCGMAMSKR